MQASITKSLLWAAQTTLVFVTIFGVLGKGVALERGRQKGAPTSKNVILPLLALIAWKRLQINTDLLHIITSTGDALFRFVNIDDLERPWTQKKGFGIFLQFWLQHTFQQWIATKWLERGQGNLHIKFSALNVDFSSPSPKVWGGLRRWASKTATSPLKSGYRGILPMLARVAWKRLQIGTDMLLIITSTGDRLFRFINIDDLEPVSYTHLTLPTILRV